MSTTLRLTTLTAALAVATSAQAMETELQSGGLVIGDGGKTKPYSVVVSSDLANKGMDQGWVISDDTTARIKASARVYGFGLTMLGQFAVNQDKTATFRANGSRDTEPATPVAAYYRNIAEAQARWLSQFTGNPYINATYLPREIKPAEMENLNVKLDYLFQINGVYGDNGPFLQIIPHAEWNTYPYQTSNDLKNKQRWVGGDVWWATFIPGVELGVNSDWNVGMSGYRGAGALREFYQAAPFDLTFWQVVNWGSAHYHDYFTGSSKSGLTYSQIGGKATLPLPWVNWWAYGTADWTYWLNRQDRDRIAVMGRDVGTLQFAMGIEYRPVR